MSQIPTRARRSKKAHGAGRRERQATSGSRGETPRAATAAAILSAADLGTHRQVSAVRTAASSQNQLPAVSIAKATSERAAVAGEAGTSASLPSENAGGGDDVF